MGQNCSFFSDRDSVLEPRVHSVDTANLREPLRFNSKSTYDSNRKVEMKIGGAQVPLQS